MLNKLDMFELTHAVPGGLPLSTLREEYVAKATPSDPYAPYVRRTEVLQESQIPQTVRVTKRDRRQEVLVEALDIVTGARNKAYGSAEDNFQNIANLWNAYLKTTLTTVDVANMMVLLKVARLKHSPDHRDSWVDIAGYAACGAECGIKGEKGTTY